LAWVKTTVQDASARNSGFIYDRNYASNALASMERPRAIGYSLDAEDCGFFAAVRAK